MLHSYGHRPSHAIPIALIFSFYPSAAAAQAGSVELPPLLPEAEEIALAQSAAPPAISRDATVLVLRRGGYVSVVTGTNGFTCMVDRIFVDSREPICYNPEAGATIMQMQLRRAALRARGLDAASIEREIEAAFARGELREPQELALGYMFSSGQVIITDSGTHKGRWMPHLMVYRPGLQWGAVGRSGEPGHPVVWRSGRRDAAMIVIVPAFVDPLPVG